MDEVKSTTKEKLSAIEQQVGQLLETLSQVAGSMSNLVSRVEALEKEAGKNAGQAPGQVLRNKMKSFTNFGPVAVDGNGNPLTEVDRAIANGEKPIMRMQGSGQAILETIQANKQ